MMGRNHKSTIETIVERKSRYTIIVKLESKKSDEVAKMFSKKLNLLQNIFKKSMTDHNGIEMVKHE
jgi:IS30 family transposase